VHPNVPEIVTFSQLNDPGPSKANLFADEQAGSNPDLSSIDDGYFAANLAETRWQNVPASRHGNGGVATIMSNSGTGVSQPPTHSRATWWRQ
jgi:hypothetical protein